MTKLCDLYGLIPKAYTGKSTVWKDLFGIELEIENLSDVPELEGWSIKADGSLRNGYEYILSEPLGGDALQAAIDRFYAAKFKYTNGPRTSTHIHVNATDMSVENLRTMIIIMYTIEDALFHAIGETRKWAGYAMPLRDMEAPRLRTILTSDDDQVLRANISTKRNQDRYYGFNTCVGRHGTVEFRYFPGGPSKEELTSWVELVSAVKTAAMTTPLQSLANYAHDSRDLMAYLRSILPAFWFARLSGLNAPEEFMSNFSDVAALCFGEESPARREALVFGTTPLKKYITTALFKGAGKEIILNVMKNIPVMTLGEWQVHVSDAWHKDNNTASEQKTSKKAPTIPDWVNEVDVPEWYQNPIRTDGYGNANAATVLRDVIRQEAQEFDYDAYAARVRAAARDQAARTINEVVAPRYIRPGSARPAAPRYNPPRNI